MWYKNMGTSFFRFVTTHAFDRQTDGQADRQTVFSWLYRALHITYKQTCIHVLNYTL